MSEKQQQVKMVIELARDYADVEMTEQEAAVHAERIVQQHACKYLQGDRAACNRVDDFYYDARDYFRG